MVSRDAMVACCYRLHGRGCGRHLVCGTSIFEERVVLRAHCYHSVSAEFLSRDPMVATTRSPYGYVGGNPLNHADPTGLIDPSQLSQDQINTIHQQCSTWQNRSVCEQAAFCAESTYGIGHLSGGDCHAIAQIAADDYNVVARGLANAGPCDAVQLTGGYMASHAEAERDLAETRAAFQVANASIAWYNQDNACKQGSAIGGVVLTTGGLMFVPVISALSGAAAAESAGEVFNSFAEASSGAHSGVATGLIGGLIMTGAC